MGPEYQLPRNRYQRPEQKPTPTSAPLPTDQNQPTSNPYSFILDANHKPKRKLLSNNGHRSFRSKIVMLLGGAGALIAVIILVANLLGSAGQKNAKMLVELAAEQQEIVRVIGLGTTKVSDPKVKSFAQTAQLSVSSDRKTLLGYLVTKKVEYTPVELSAKKDTAFDKDLAKVSGDAYDEMFAEKIESLLTSYRANVAKNYNRASNNTSKAFLAESYGSLTTLLKN